MQRRKPVSVFQLKEKLIFLRTESEPRTALGFSPSDGDSMELFATLVGVSVHTLNDAIKGGSDRIGEEAADRIAAKVGFSTRWVEWRDIEDTRSHTSAEKTYDPPRRDNAAAFKAAFIRHFRRAEESNAVLSSRTRQPASDTPRTFETRLGNDTWALNTHLASLRFVGSQDAPPSADFEFSAQPAIITIRDATDKHVLLQRRQILTHCHIEFDLDSAQVRGGLSKVKAAVAAYLKQPEAAHLTILVKGDAAKPTLELSSGKGVPIGLIRPFIAPATEAEENPLVLCLLENLAAGKKVTARVRIYGSALQDTDATDDSILTFDDDVEPPLTGVTNKPVPPADTARILSHLFKMAQTSEGVPSPQEPGELVLACDTRLIVERSYDKK